MVNGNVSSLMIDDQHHI